MKMSYFDEIDDNNFYEPSEFDEKIDDLKFTLKQSIKKEFFDRMELLEKENAELQSVKNRMDEIEYEHMRFQHSMEQKIKEAQANVRKERLIELLGENMTVAWGVNNVGAERPKCDKCDEQRRINFKSPQGNNCSEYCDCSIKDYIYIPEEYKLIKIEVEGIDIPYYYRYYTNNTINPTCEHCNTTNVYKDGEPFDKVNSYQIVFLDKETCQKYCDWKNKKTPD
jgi:hypothetical protein